MTSMLFELDDVREMHRAGLMGDDEVQQWLKRANFRTRLRRRRELGISSPFMDRIGVLDPVPVENAMLGMIPRGHPTPETSPRTTGKSSAYQQTPSRKDEKRSPTPGEKRPSGYSRGPLVAIGLGAAMIVTAYLLTVFGGAVAELLSQLGRAVEGNPFVFYAAFVVTVAAALVSYGVHRIMREKRGLSMMDKELKTKVVSLIVTIVGLIAFANVAQGGVGGFYPNLHVSEVQVDPAEYGGEEYPQWVHGWLCLGVTYINGIEVTASGPISDVYLTLEISKPGIQSGDVVIRYWDGTDWTGSNFTVGDGVLVYTFPDERLSVTSNDSVVVVFLVTFMSEGTYTSRLWAAGYG